MNGVEGNVGEHMVGIRDGKQGGRGVVQKGKINVTYSFFFTTPLPDERPRASVANLIGRFEQQTKRQSIAGTNGAPRPSIVSAQNTGDSAKEEPKEREKREWPPKLVQDDKPISSLLSSSTSVKETPLVVAEPLPAPTPEVATEELVPQPQVPASPPRTTASKPQRQSTIGTPSKSSSIVPRTHSSPVKVPPAKEPRKAPSAAKSPPTAPVNLPVPTLKPQHTGQSTTSTTARRSVAKAAVGTPSRPKTPSRASLGPSKVQTPTRPKTPSTTSRPKTPSHLFAPTAASLARARNAPDAKPTPVKKATLSASAADRLSKPTAASLSKARSPIPISPAPSRGGAKPTGIRSVSSTRGTAKPRGGAVAPRSRADGAKTATKVAAATAGAAIAGAGTTILSGSEDEEGAHKDTEAPSGPEDDAPIDELHELEAEAVVSPEPVEAVLEIPVEAGVAVEGVVDEVEEHPQADSLSDSGNVLSGDETNLEQDAGLDSDVAGIQPIPTGSDKTAVDDLEEELSSDAADRMDEVKARPAPDDDLVAMVNMLESKPTTTFRPEIAAGIPQEDVQEIPDED
ncbi:hypothetical protein EYR38_007887 [Pleurotus pulmonarius]|nr:hypothetical protein EYR38_007887 [Pleurotus pulmonarius]